MYQVEELVAGKPANGQWKRSPTMIDRIGRCTFASEDGARIAVTDLCEWLDDEPERYRVVEVD